MPVLPFCPLLRGLRYKLLLSLLWLLLVGVPVLRAQNSDVTKTTIAASALDELQARLDALRSAEQTGDVTQIAQANRNLLAVSLRAMAELNLAQGDTAVSVDLYKRSLDFEDTPAAHLALALIYMRAHRTEDALATVEPILKADPGNGDAWNVDGKLLMDKKQYARAAEALSHSLELQGNVYVAYALATAYLNLHEKEKAAAIFQQLSTASGDSASVHVMTGRAYQNAGMMDDAIREYNRAIELDAKASKGHYFLGLLYLMQNEWAPTPQAREQFLTEVKENPNDFFGNFFLGYIESNDKNYDASDRYLKVAAQARPDWPEPYLYMGLNAFGRNDLKSAEELLRKAIALTGDDKSRNNYQIRRAYYVLGRICIQSGRKEEGVGYTKIFSAMQEKTMAQSRANTPGAKTTGTMGSASGDDASAPTSAVIDPGAQTMDAEAPLLTSEQKAEFKTAEQRMRVILGNAYNDLGAAEARQKHYGVALGYFLEAEKWNPDIPHLARNIGFAAFRSNNYGESARALKVAQSQDPQDKIIMPMLAMALFSSAQYAEAAQVFAQMGDAPYSDPRMAYAWASSLAHSNQSEQARNVLAGMSQPPPAPETLLLIGQVDNTLNEPAKALENFQKASLADPMLPQAHYLAGVALLKLNRPADAVKEFQAELKLKPDDPEVHQQLEIAYRKLGRAADAAREARLAAADNRPQTAPPQKH